MLRLISSYAAKLFARVTGRTNNLSEIQQMEWVSIPPKNRKVQFGLDVRVPDGAMSSIKASLLAQNIPTTGQVIQRNGKTYLRVTDKSGLAKVSEALKANIADQLWSAVTLRDGKVVYRTKIDPNSASYARLMDSLKIHNITGQPRLLSGHWGYVEVSAAKDLPLLKTIIGSEVRGYTEPKRGFLGPKIIAHNFAR